MDKLYRRRQLLAAGATAGAVAAAGCLGTREGAVPAPTVTDDRIDNEWRLVDESNDQVFEESYGPITVQALSRSTVYEYVSVAESIAETLDAEGSPVMFFTTRIDLRPAIDSLPFGVGRDRIMTEVETAAEEAFRAELENSGIENVDTADTRTIEVDTGHEATLFEFSGTYPVAGELSFGGLSQSFDDEIEIAAHVGVWHDGTDVLLAGGAYPTDPLVEPFEETIEDAPVEVGDVLDSDTEEALSTDPETFEEDIDALLRSVE